MVPFRCCDLAARGGPCLFRVSLDCIHQSAVVDDALKAAFSAGMRTIRMAAFRTENSKWPSGWSTKRVTKILKDRVQVLRLVIDTAKFNDEMITNDPIAE